MPIYEYRCSDCKRLTSVFVRSSAAESEPVCKHCGSTKMARALSTFAYRVNGGTRGSTRDAGALDYSDPGQIGRWTESKFEQMGMDLPDSARAMIDKAREGDLPSPIDSLPD